MRVYQKEMPRETAVQICKIQQEILFERTNIDFIRSLLAGGVLFFVESDNEGEIICFCSVKPIGLEWEIYDLATIPEYQNRGYANKIISEVLNSARNSGAERLYLEVRQSNTRAINLYAKSGFEKKSIRRNYYVNNGENAVCMMKTL
jgi:ribosomal-protein-alanine N-acetyltransferase